ncbi:HAD family hydrolase [Nocardioides pantholopis]|uniref:HAD family hydrolase n=1 Tax=Nocardioides pantholopis TaxID=2483798 RepID=UPI000F07BF1E|nr:HAD-IA family hydrolase [Nocardioides pantholopis]
MDETPDGPPSGVSPSRPAGVVWDLGNVVIDWDPHAAVAAGVGPAEAARFLAASDFDFRAWNHLHDAGGTWADGLAEVARTSPHWAEHARAYHDHFPASLVGEVPGTAAIIRELHAAGVPQWGLTNWSAELYHHAPATFDVLALLEDVVVSGVEGVAKPDPRIFAVLRARTGRPLEELVFVDDRDDNVAAASAAGLHALLFRDAARLRAALRDLGLPV